MKGNTFQLEWDGNKIRYNPLLGLIEDVTRSRTVKVRRNKHERSGDGFDISPLRSCDVFQPCCLTIYAHHKCNLSCEYCYIPEKLEVRQCEIDLCAVQATAELVAKNCVTRNKPFVLGFHGGNEPLMNLQLIDTCLRTCRMTADKYGLAFRPFCTTNGVMTEEVARWAARTFYGIRLSWDGPADLHDTYRRMANGKPTSAIVKRSAKIFMNGTQTLKQLIIRVTVTQESVNRLSEIVTYFSQCGVKWIEMYPVFRTFKNSIRKEIVPPSSQFIKNFLRAQDLALKYKIKLLYAGSRLYDVHDKHCSLSQNNLTITPDGYLTACFLASHNDRNQNQRYHYGYYDTESNRIVLDTEKLSRMIRKLAKPYRQCENCFNFWHCSKGCPTVCPLQEDTQDTAGFDCTINKWIGLANLMKAVGLEIRDDQIDDVESFFSQVVVRRMNE
jgi:uncharacterized protein